MTWIKITAYGTLIFSLLYIVLSVYQMSLVRKLSKWVRLNGLEYYQFLVPFKSKSALEKNYLGGGPEADALFYKIIKQRNINGLLFFLAFLCWVGFLLLIQFG